MSGNRRPVRIVASVLVRNEDRFIEQAIRNVASFCDRIHVLDHMSNDGTPQILAALAERLDHVELSRSPRAGESHVALEPYVGTRTWVLVVDGDCLFDPHGLAELRRDLLAGAHEDVFRVRGHVLHCDALDPAADTASGFMAPPSRPIVQLFNLGALESWTGCPERVHGGSPVFRPAYEWQRVEDLAESTEWSTDPLRLLHVCFLRRSSRDRGEWALGRANLNEEGAYRRGAIGVLRRIVRRPTLDPKVREIHRQGRNWKQEKYRRGPRMSVSASPFVEAGLPV
jgi:glycosyltransferase involved in cell wall biosynthesis